MHVCVCFISLSCCLWSVCLSPFLSLSVGGGVCVLCSLCLAVSVSLSLSVCSNETMESVQVHSVAAMHKSRLEDSVLASSVICSGPPVTSSEVGQAISMNCTDFTSLSPPTINFYLIYWCSHSGHIWPIHFKSLIKHSLVLALSWAQKKKTNERVSLFSICRVNVDLMPKTNFMWLQKAMPNTPPPAAELMSLRGRKKEKQ